MGIAWQSYENLTDNNDLNLDQSYSPTTCKEVVTFKKQKQPLWYCYFGGEHRFVPVLLKLNKMGIFRQNYAILA